MKIVLTEKQLQRVKKLMNEDIKSDSRFSQECMVDLDYYGTTFNGNDIEWIDAEKVKVNFNIDLEYREYGIKGAYVSVNGGTDELVLSVQFYPEGSDEPQTEEVILPINWDSANEETDDSLGYIGINNSVDVKLMNDENGSLAIESIVVHVKGI